MRALRVLIVSVAWVAAAPFQTHAEDSAAGGSLLGYVFDPAVGAVRPIQGIPGAARLGDPLSLPDLYWSMAISPAQNYALGTTDSGVSVITFSGGASASSAPLSAVAPAPDLVAFNASGSAAALYNRAQNSVYIITGLPASPALARQVDAAPAGAPVISLALSDDASGLLAGCSDGASGAVYWFDGGGNMRSVLAAPHPASLLFLRGSQDAVVADDQANTIWLVRDVSGGAQTAVLAGQADGIAAPMALAQTDSGRVLVANTAAVSVLDTGGTAPVNVACPCRLSTLGSLTDDTVFRLTSVSTGPLWLLDLSSDQARILFVPPATPAAGAQQ